MACSRAYALFALKVGCRLAVVARLYRRLGRRFTLAHTSVGCDQRATTLRWLIRYDRFCATAEPLTATSAHIRLCHCALRWR